MRTTLADLGYAVRTLSRQRLFTLVALLTLALGIGANSAIFAVVDAALLRPLPFGEPGRIVVIEDLIRKLTPNGIEVTPYDLAQYQTASHSFEAVAGFTPTSLDLTGVGEPTRLEALRVSPEIFQVLGVSPAMGRGFTSAEDRPQSGVAVISYRLWQDRFGGDRGIVGRAVSLDRRPVTIVGVLPRDIEFPMPGLPFGRPRDIWVPLGVTERERSTVGMYVIAVVGRLKPGVTLAQANDDVQQVAARIRESFPVAVRTQAFLEGQAALVQERVQQNSRELLWLLAGAVGFVLLIACVNVANLLLARAAGRERELAIRASFGASRARLLRQLLTESLLLSSIGGAAGLLLAMWLVTLLARVIPRSVPRAASIELDWRVVAFTAAISILSGLLFGIIPAFTASRTNQAARMKATNPTGLLRSVLVVSEVALSLVLLVGAGLLVRSLVALRAVNPGFDVQHLVTAQIALPPTVYSDTATIRGFFDRAVGELSSIPGVRAAGASTAPLLVLRNQRLFTLRQPTSLQPLAVNATVIGDYFEAAGLRVLRGRMFDSRDRRGSMLSLVINDTMARQYFPGKEAVGQEVKLGSPQSPDPWYTVIGVVSDSKNNDLDKEVRPQVYQPYAQLSDGEILAGFGRSLVIAVKAAGDPQSVTSEVRSAVKRLDPQLPVSQLQTVRAQMEASLAPQWFQTGLVASFAALALILAAIGIYGVVSYGVSQRTREIGVRMALGADRLRVLKLVIWQGMRLLIAGVTIGLLGALALTRLLTSFLFGVKPTDAMTFGFAAVALCVVAVIANLAPARRASTVDPMIALRYE